MTQIEAFQKELEKEAEATRKMLSIVPVDKMDWAPHAKSMKMRNLAIHIAELPTWVGMALNTSGLDFSANPYQQKDIRTTEALVAFFEECQADARKQLAGAKEETLGELWTLRDGDTIYSTEPKWEVIRMAMSQIIHHRAQLGVYLRLLDIPIPGSYGPSADQGF